MTVLTTAEIEQQYPDEWVLMEVIREHKAHAKVAGHLLAHSPDRAALEEPYRRFRAAHPRAHLYEFYTGDLVAEGVVAIL